MNTIAKRIREARQSAGLTQDALAQRIGARHPAQVQYWERGEYNSISTRTLLRIAKGLGVSVDKLLIEEEKA